ncbi:MAG TPA: hypothetical protein VFQ88_04205 [Nevskiaceae bacterium]|nr:hypothetical protein [Nevskiaceae bacterium]
MPNPPTKPSSVATLQRLALRHPLGWLLIALAVTAAVYSLGLGGGFLFDDFPNIVDNPALRLHDLSLPDLANAALSSPSSEFKRPLSSITFALNEYFAGGLDPVGMKLTNIVIHLANGVLLYLLTLALLGGLGTRGPPLASRDPRWTALFVATGWLLLPINLTGVLYIVQRMASLANLFVLLGLLGYVHGRRRMLNGHRGLALATTALVLGTAIGFTAKETAIMTPLYALLIEWLVFGFRRTVPVADTPRRDWRIVVLFLIVLVLPLIAGLSWEVPKVLRPSAWATRDFTLDQRLLSELHIIADYVRWTLLPTPDALSFYHDGYPVSTGWLHPWTTLGGGVFLAALVAFAIAIRRRAPLVALGIGLFFAAQLLTGTILPLELVYEHRNYFASAGLLLALIPFLCAPGAMPLARRVLLGGLLVLWTAETAMTAYGWGTPLRLSVTLAERAPNSPRAQYGLGRTYVILSHYDPNSPYTKLAYAPLERAMRLPGSSILPEQALIMMNSTMHRPLKDSWWQQIDTTLRARRPGAQDITSMAALTHCAVARRCDLPKGKMIAAFMAGLSHPNPDARLLAAYSDYAWNVLGDERLGLSMARDTIHAAPNVAAYHITLLRMEVVAGHRNAARQQLAVLRQLNVAGSLDRDIAAAQRLVDPPASARSH